MLLYTNFSVLFLYIDCVVWLRRKIKKGGLSNTMKYQRYKYCNGHVKYDDEEAVGDEDTKH